VGREGRITDYCISFCSVGRLLLKLNTGVTKLVRTLMKVQSYNICRERYINAAKKPSENVRNV
jgi:hypothetical protein